MADFNGVFIGVLLGDFNGHEDVVMERSCIERITYEQALADAEMMLKLTQSMPGENLRASVSVEVAE